MHKILTYFNDKANIRYICIHISFKLFRHIYIRSVLLSQDQTYTLDPWVLKGLEDLGSKRTRTRPISS